MLPVKAHYFLVSPDPVDPGEGRPPYYGVARTKHAHVMDLTEGSPTYWIWREEIEAKEEEEEWCLFFGELDVARTFRRRYAEQGYEFQIIAVYPCESEADVSAVEKLPGYLGLDVASTEPDSALHPAWMWCSYSDAAAQADPIIPILRLEQACFRPRLNRWGLLNSWVDASLLYDVKQALQKIEPNCEPAGVRILAIVQVEPSP